MRPPRPRRMKPDKMGGFVERRSLPLWIPDGEDGWILSFPGGAQLWFAEDQKTVWGFEREGFRIRRVL